MFQVVTVFMAEDNKMLNEKKIAQSVVKIKGSRKNNNYSKARLLKTLLCTVHTQNVALIKTNFLVPSETKIQ